MASNVTTRPKSTNGLKRSRDDHDLDDDEFEAEDQPRKLPAISYGLARPGVNGGPLRPSRTAMNIASIPGPSTTKPTIALRSRATSAPPKSITGRPPAPSGPSAATKGRVVSGGRTASGSAGRRLGAGGPLAKNEDGRLFALQEQVTSMESARAADLARLEQEMEMEKARVTELQTNHMNMERNLASARAQELAQRRELNSAADELEKLKRQYSRETEELESDRKRKDRELRDTKEDLRLTQADLDRERENVQALKATLETQSTTHLTLTAQNNALQVQLQTLRSSLDYSSADASNMRLELESLRKKTAELEDELLEAEMVRRRLHNMVQELKGNIRVFCRVRPLLPSDIPPEVMLSLSNKSPITALSSSEDSKKIKEQCLARIDFPDRRDHKEIMLSSSGENAMGQERNEHWNFAFDRVSYMIFHKCRYS